MSNIKTLVDSIRRDSRSGAKLANNTQRVGLKLLAADGEWIPRYRLTTVPSGTARVRDLRKEAYGGFEVECKSSDDLNRKTSKKTFYYRINTNHVTQSQVQKLFSV
jgi:hypothetical protein